MMWGGALGLLPILSFPPGECCQTSLNFFFPLFSLFLLLFQKIIYSHSRNLTESLNTFANPLLPSRRVLPNIPQLFLSIFSFFFCQSSKASSSKESQQTIYSRLVNVIFSPSRLRMKRWIDELKTESQIKKKTHLAWRKLGNAVENVWKRWGCSRYQRKLIWTLKKSSQCGYLSSWDSNWRIFSFLLKICYVCVVHLYVHVDDDKEMLMIVLMASRIADWIIMEDKLIDLQLKACFCPSLHRDQINWNVFTLGKSKVDIFSMGLIMNMGRKNIWDLISSIICW